MSDSTDDALAQRVVVLLPPGPDADLARSVLELAQLNNHFCADVGELCREVVRAAGAVLLAEETLNPAALHAIVQVLNQQEVWSDLPLVVFFLRVGPSAQTGLRMLDILEPLGNVTILERPVRTMTLVSALQSALRARRRQYQVRDLLRQREESVQDSDQFLTILSHELRNPLSALRAVTHVLQSVPSRTSFEQEQLGILERQINRLARLVDGILDVHRVISRRMTLRRETIDLREVLRLANAQFGCPSHGIATMPLLILGDPDSLEQVLHHLLAEAEPSTLQPTLSARVQGDEVLVSIHGSAMRKLGGQIPSVPDRLTGALQLFDHSRNALGVAVLLVRNIVELHGGRVELSSEELVLRFRQAEPTLLPTAPQPVNRLDQRRVLVVEDNADARESLRMLLQIWGHEVVCAANGLEAVEQARQNNPDVALVDIGLPGPNGYDVGRELRAALGNDIQLIAVTGYAEPHDRRRALEAGFDDFLSKPLSLHALRALLRST